MPNPKIPKYDPKTIEPKWQQAWADTKLYAAQDNDKTRPKYYYLVEFPYPSGDGLHVGHVLSYTALDIMARHKRMEGFNVLYPMGFDEFGLPTENFAIKNKIAPQVATERNVANFIRQMKSLGLGFDWDRMVRTSDPNYYKWTQWIFLQLYKKGLAYQAELPINWCPFEKTGLANEEVVDGKHERCGTPVEKKLLKQWVLRITAYADRLAEDLASLNYIERAAVQQINWIGRSEGAEITWQLQGLPAGAGAPLEPVTGTPQPDEEFRRSIVAVVRDPKTGQLLTINWGDGNGGTIFIGGGIDEGEDVVEAARREVAEETGYRHLKHIATSDRVHHHYVAHSKGGKKRYIHAWGVYFELENDERDQTKLEQDEAGKFTVEWQTPEQADTHVHDELHRYMLDTFVLNRPFTGQRVAAADGQPAVTVYTTRPDTIFGATFLVVSPEVAKTWLDAGWQPAKDVAAYITKALNATELSRQEQTKVKTGEDTGVKAVHPLTGELVPVWVADYVLGSYGTGAIMAVPAHDERDVEFAHAFDLPIVPVVAQDFGEVLPDSKDVEGSVVIGYDPATKQYLGLKNHNVDLGWLISGGRDEGETFADTARRELAEEAGYHDIQQLIQLGDPVYSYYYNDNKKSNRRSLGYNFLAILDSTQPTKANNEAHEKFTPQWMSFSELYQDITNTKGGVEHWLNALDKARAAVAQIERGESYQAPVYTGYGPLINSGDFNGLTGTEAKRAIVAKLFEQGAGKGATKYKLRDWIFSRQHYWGEPIPIVHCPACALKDAKPKLSLNFYDQPTWDAILNGIKTVESRALNPDEKNRYFGGVQSGDILELVNKTAHDKVAVQVIETRTYKSVKDFHADTDWSTAVSETGQQKSLDHQTKDFASYAPDYADRIKQHGLVAWKIKLLTKAVPVPESELPLKLPAVDHYEPTDTGESPLAAIPEFVNTTCPQCDGPAKRETDTMPNWAGSSWYYLRYADPHNDKAFADPQKLEYWTPVDHYNGGMEHTTLHLLYSRFWHKFLYDQGLVPTPEPYAKRTSHGMILGPDGQKMSKSRGNVINPDHVVERYGADTIRLYEMFMGPFDQEKAWSEDHLNGVSRFIYRIWTLAQDILAAHPGPESQVVGPAEENTGEFATLVDRHTHKTLKKVHHDIDTMDFNTAVSALMEYINFLTDTKTKAELLTPGQSALARRTLRTLVLMLAPFVPHMTEELWHELGEEGSVHTAGWPKYDPALIKEDLVTIVVQVNGKVRANLIAAVDTAEAELTTLAQADPNVTKHLEGKEIVKTIVVPRKLVNFVVK